jgi:hypothetical protein
MNQANPQGDDGESRQRGDEHGGARANYRVE